MSSLLLLPLAAAAFAAVPYPTHTCSDPAAQEAINQVEKKVYFAAMGRDNALESVRMVAETVKEFQDNSVAEMERQLTALPDDVVRQLGGFFKKVLAVREGEDLSPAAAARFPVPAGADLEALLQAQDARRKALPELSRQDAQRRAPEIRERQLQEAREFKASLQLPFFLKPVRSAVEGVVNRFVDQTGAGVPEMEAALVSARASAALAELSLQEIARLRDSSLGLCR